MNEAVYKAIEDVVVGDQLVERDGALVLVTNVEHKKVRNATRVVLTFAAFGPSPGGQVRRNTGGPRFLVVPALAPESSAPEPAAANDDALAKARADLLAAGFSEAEIEAPTGFGLRRLPTCPAVAPLVLKVATGALSVQGALNTRKAATR